MTAAERKEWKRISKPAARQRSDRDESTVRIVISIKPELLAEAHRLAQRSGSSLSALIAGSLQDKVSKQRRIA